MGGKRHPNVVNLSELEARNTKMGTRFGAQMKWLGRAAGSRKLGCSWYEVEPGRSAFPRHAHLGKEEAMFVLEGKGALRIGEETVTVKAGDYVSLPAGPEYAHLLTNTGTEPLRYLAFSTTETVDVVQYPDSQKTAVLAMSEYSDQGKLWVRTLLREGRETQDYYEGEKID